MSQTQATDPYTLNWVDRMKAKWRGESVADATLARLIKKTAASTDRWKTPSVQDLFNTTLAQGANLDLALERAMGQNAEAAHDLLDRGAKVTEAGLLNLARWTNRWVSETHDEWWDSTMDAWNGKELAERLIRQEPRHPGWLQRIPGKQQTVINAVCQAHDTLGTLYDQITPENVEEEVQKLLNWHDPVKQIKFVVRGTLGKGGDRIRNEVQLALVKEAVSRRPELGTNLKLAEMALASQSWEVAQFFRQQLGSFPADMLLRVAGGMAHETGRKVQLNLDDDERDDFMRLLAEDLPPDFDLDQEVKVLLDDQLWSSTDPTEHTISLRELCGDGFRVLEAHFRRRKLMDQFGHVIEQRAEDPAARTPRM